MTDSTVPDDVEPENLDAVGGLGEVLPEPLVPIYERLQLIQRFRENYGPTYTTALEGIVALFLVVGYGYWLYLYLVVGG